MAHVPPLSPRDPELCLLWSELCHSLALLFSSLGIVSIMKSNDGGILVQGWAAGKLSSTRSLGLPSSQQQTEANGWTLNIASLHQGPLQKAIWILQTSWLNLNYLDASLISLVSACHYGHFTVYLPFHKFSEPHNSWCCDYWFIFIDKTWSQQVTCPRKCDKWMETQRSSYPGTVIFFPLLRKLWFI